MNAHTTMEQEKIRLRKQARSILHHIPVEERDRASEAIKRRIFDSDLLPQDGLIGCYISMPREVQTHELIHTLWERYASIAVPSFRPEHGCYEWCRMRSDSPMTNGPWSIPQPQHFELVQASDIDVIFVPGLAFDRMGHRLGQGAGFFDRLLENAQGACAGIAFAQQLVEEVPSLPHDVPMNVVITETEQIKTDQ